MFGSFMEPFNYPVKTTSSLNKFWDPSSQRNSLSTSH